ncbi:cytochrome P450 [Mrakia frigida]|uniref:cytochrome P450 n=1 Tax=Mrakia frigida TaxID=29902 RepID=UPI003FCC254A
MTSGPFCELISWAKRLHPDARAARDRNDLYVIDRVEKTRQKIRGGGEIDGVKSMIDIIVRKEASNGEGEVMPEDELRDELTAFMFAGAETSSTTQLWVRSFKTTRDLVNPSLKFRVYQVLKFLSENPEVQKRLHDELARALPSPDDRAPTLDEITPDLTPYFEAVVQECSRLAQAVHSTDRQALVDTTLFGPNGEEYAIPAGTGIFLLTGWATRHQYLDSEEFRPERWLDEKGRFDATRVWSASFGGGTRMCYGYKIALVFLRLFIAQLSLSYFILPLPYHLRSETTTERITRKPDTNWVGLRRWDEMPEAMVAGGEEKSN